MKIPILLKKIIFSFVVLATLLIFAGCSNGNKAGQTSVKLYVSAAASLGNALQEIGDAYKKLNPGIEVYFNFGGSGTLQQQIEQGAPADLFISANEEKMDRLQKKGLIIEETRTDILSNELVLVTSKELKGKMTEWDDLATSLVNKIAMGDPQYVPAGKYGMEALKTIGIWDKIQNKLVFAKDVTQVLTYVESGNVAAGIVYSSDVIRSKEIEIGFTIDSTAHSPILYTMSILKNSVNQQAAKDFYQFILGEQALEIFKKYGFQMIERLSS
ncbi:molybdate ABC transporter substrate-binding protein [Microaerobacter geothermalis]|uniref:molybdate ABC transporter substrate-binding protein n=1 Tax=Microaerobacter geothermalis TaxID=674972 RepID=UPI001F2AA0BC|nr:molybdate ABC transporter substrate-binding protein [Microaerobacter geothermalis]MCF6093012.1 molybdate ABC transporter substrate-binding protein [Microaerobacter geothermalis]